MQQQLTILFADIANSTWLFQQKGDVLAYQLVAKSLSDLTEQIEFHRGKLLRTVGDSVLASFANPDDALSAAAGMQVVHQDSMLSIRVGFHTGSVIPDRGDVYGNAVNIAARIASFAKPTEIYTSELTVHKLSPVNQAKTGFLDRVDFKGVSLPLAIHRVAWRAAAQIDPGESFIDDTRIVVHHEDTSRYHIDYKLELRLATTAYCIDPEHRLVVTIGRAKNNDIVVNHDSTSRNHAVVEFFHGKYHFRDTSTNGSYIVSNSGSTHFLRREQAVIEGSGVIGAGWKPDKSDTEGVGFKMIALAVKA